MTHQGTVREMLDSASDSSEETPAVDLAARFRVSQERGAKHAAEAGIEVKAVPATVRQARAEATEEDLAEAEALLAESLRSSR